MARQGKVSILIQIRDGTAAALASAKSRMAKWAADVKGYLTSVNGALAALTASLTAASVGAFVVRSTMEFQRFSAQLKIFSGSAAGASAKMDELKRLAMELPFDLASITEAFITLRSGGIDPSEERFRKLGDIASGMGKDILTLAQATKNAVFGEMEMLKQFGVSMVVQGNQLRASFGGTTEMIGRDAESVLGFLERIATKDFSGAAAARMQTLEGAFSNLADQAWNLAVVIGTKGGVADALTEAAGRASELAEALSRNEQTLVTWSRRFVAVLQFTGSAIWTGLVVPFEAVTTTIGLAMAAVLQFGASTMAVLHGVAKAIADVTGNDALAKLTDPAWLQGAANTAFEFARNRAEGGVAQIEQLAQRLANLAVAMEGEPIGTGGFATPGKPRRGPSGTGDRSAIEEYEKDQRERAKRLQEREDRDAKAARGGFEETPLLKNQLDRAAGLEDLMRGIRPSTVPGMDAALQEEQVAALNAELAKTISSLDIASAGGISFGKQLGAALAESAGEAQNLEQRMVSVLRHGINETITGMVAAFGQVTEGWDAVGESMIRAVRGAIAEMAALEAKYYMGQAIAAVGRALTDLPRAGMHLAAAAKFSAAAAAFTALSGVAGSAGAGGVGGGGGVSRARANEGLDEATGGPVTLVLNGDRFNLNDPRTQDEMRAILERLSGRSVEIRSR